MPYVIEERSGKYCVIKVSTGKPIPGGCHSTARQAGAHKTAIERSEALTSKEVDSDELDAVFAKYHDLVNMSASELERWAETEYSGLASLSDAPIQRNLRLLKKPKVEWDNRDIADANRTIAFISRMRNMEQGKPVRADVPYSKRDISLRNWAYNPDKTKQDSRENDPEYYAIVPDRELRSTWKLPMLDFEQTSAAIQALSPKGFRGQRVEIPRGVSRAAVIRKIQRRIASIQASDDAKDQLRARLTQIKSISMIFKGADGLRRMFLITSNAYEDREDETITSEALKEYVESQWEGDIWKGNNFLLFVHRGAPIGEIVFAEMMESFLVEVAKELNTPYARKRWDYIEAHPDMDWGASHGFDFDEDTKTDGVYHHIEKFETTVLPLARAANALTLAGVIT